MLCFARFSLDVSEMDLATEREQESEETLKISRPWVTKANLLIEPDDGNICLQGDVMENKDVDSTGKRIRSKSMPSTLDKISAPRISRSLESSCPVIEGIQPPQMETIEKDHVEPTHVLFVQQVLQELKQYHGTEEAAKPEKVEKGTKVKRRLSSLKNRVTGSWQKEKGKVKEQLKEKGRDPKDK
ncbi:rho guanine nucleotide exchange factor 18-like [Pelobates fuscus]|uniref:rho guanine nucleotide exchange factor 18-like n=1 Tax=Pelobates fuscus TaxID=191477 RepID=UPI002FE4B2FE